MNTYVILRRSAWRAAADQEAAAERSAIEADKVPEEIRWIRSYVLAEPGETVGTVCIYQASSPEAIRAHAGKADLPVDEIIAVTGTMIVRPDPEPAPVYGRAALAPAGSAVRWRERAAARRTP